MTELDTSRAPRGVLAAQQLIAVIAKLGDLAERHYLELNSTLDLSTKKDKEKIAKFILGAGNRMPDVASTAVEGYGAMVIGVSKDAVVFLMTTVLTAIQNRIEYRLNRSHGATPQADLQKVTTGAETEENTRWPVATRTI